jgi:hypothetical protein
MLIILTFGLVAFAGGFMLAAVIYSGERRKC